MATFVYSSQEAYNSCLSLFPVLKSNQHSTISRVNSNTTVKEQKKKLAELKKEQRSKYKLSLLNASQRKRLPTLTTEKTSDIIESKEVYTSRNALPACSKILFAKNDQDSFQINSELHTLIEMFPSIDFETIKNEYEAVSMSLERTIDILLELACDDSMTTYLKEDVALSSNTIDDGVLQHGKSSHEYDFSATCFDDDLVFVSAEEEMGDKIYDEQNEWVLLSDTTTSMSYRDILVGDKNIHISPSVSPTIK